VSTVGSLAEPVDWSKTHDDDCPGCDTDRLCDALELALAALELIASENDGEPAAQHICRAALSGVAGVLGEEQKP